MKTEQYFKNLREQVDKIYSVAQKARSKGYDPVDEVEIPLAMSMAEKVVGIISTMYPQMQGSGIADRILELEKDYGKLDSTIPFKIAEEVAEQKFCKFENLTEAMEAGIRIGFGYQTIGVVSSPLEGFTGLKIRKTREGKDYVEASFSGPIRSAGTTASVVCLMIIDFLREKFGFAKYDPAEDEVKRVWTELEHFHDRVANLQGMPTEIEALYLAERMPIQVAGDPSEKIEVPNHKNLERVDTNFLRSGFCLILAEGLAQKAKKGFRLYNHAKDNGVKMSGFDWLNDYLALQDKVSKGKTQTVDSVPQYIRDLVAGRPIFGHPSRSGSLRFRYGRGRNSGFSAAALHPATMAITDGQSSVSSDPETFKDSCESENVVTEYFCGNESYVHRENVSCSDFLENSSCIFGACVIENSSNSSDCLSLGYFCLDNVSLCSGEVLNYTCSGDSFCCSNSSEIQNESEDNFNFDSVGASQNDSFQGGDGTGFEEDGPLEEQTESETSTVSCEPGEICDTTSASKENNSYNWVWIVLVIIVLSLLAFLFFKIRERMLNRKKFLANQTRQTNLPN